MFERLLKTAKELGETHSPPDVPEALSRAVPEHVTVKDVRDLLAQQDGVDAAAQNIQDSVAVLWAVYAVLKSHDGVLEREEDSKSDTLSEIADAVGKIMEPVCPIVEADEEDNTNYTPLALKGALGLHILDLITRSQQPPFPLPASALLSTVAYTRAADPWTAGDAAAALAQSLLLRARFPPGKRGDIADVVLAGFLRPLFARSRPAGVTAAGRRAAYPAEEGGAGEPARYRYVGAGSDPAAKPWMHARRYAVTVFEWAVENADTSLIKSHWPLFTPVLLALLDEPGTGVKLRGLRALRAFWARLPPGLMRDTGLAPVFEQAVFPAVLNLPSLTPEDESVSLLAAAYPALFDMAGVVVVERGEKEAEMTQAKTKKIGDFTEEQRALVDRIVREGIMTGYHHAKEHVRLVGLLCEELRCLVDGIGILAVKYLKDFIPMTSEILTDPFGTKHPPSLLAAVQLLQAILRSCWPRIPGRENEIIKTLMLCWLNIDDDEEAFPGDGQPSPADLKAELTKTAQMLSAIMKAARVDMSERVGPLIEKEPQLSALFQDYEAA
ncbi:hypothetical protein F4809DRAFT_663900 [Biscogniauxia mediterranea]|nr:hypothetical protein F4809DRAFT_663900 [Biscogniauxia mediterranea]